MDLQEKALLPSLLVAEAREEEAVIDGTQSQGSCLVKATTP